MKRLVWAFAFFVSGSTYAATVLPIEALRLPLNGSSSDLRSLVLDDRYRLGSEWGKVPVTPADLEAAPETFKRAALATAKAGGGTAFYLGHFAGHHVMATNHHVFPRSSSCLGKTIQFPLLGVNARCAKFFGSWSDIDLALFTIEMSGAQDELKLARVAGNFAFHAPIYPGQELLTIGFGVANNPMRRLVANQDSDCKVFSGQDEFRFMGDPDDFNPAPYRAWSFANGCDVSHGDSGSAMVDRATGQVVGIIWTGRIPKSSQVQDSTLLDELFRTGDEAIWKELSYAVPARKIGALLQTIADNPATPSETRSVLQELLTQSP